MKSRPLAALRQLMAGWVALLCLACMGSPTATGRGTYILKRPGTLSTPSQQVAANAAAEFCAKQDRVMRPVRESPESGPWGEPLTELTFRCLSPEQAH